MPEPTQPWEKSQLEVEIIDTNEAEILGEIEGVEGQYVIAIPDYDGRQVEITMSKERFGDLPHPTRVGTHFGLIVYKEAGEINAGPWPVTKYWNPELKEE